MNFQRRRGHDEPEINFIPLIDLLLVVLIFLLVSTTYTKFSSLSLTLSSQSAQTDNRDHFDGVSLGISAQGMYQLGERQFGEHQKIELIEALKATKTQFDAQQKSLVLMIYADRFSTHDSLIHVMEMAAHAGFSEVRLLTEQAPSP